MQYEILLKRVWYFFFKINYLTDFVICYYTACLKYFLARCTKNKSQIKI